MPDNHGSLVRFNLDPEELAGKVARGAVTILRDPEALSGVAGAVVLPLIVFRGHKVPLLPLFVICLIGQQGGRMAWRASRDLAAIARAATDPVKPDA